MSQKLKVNDCVRFNNKYLSEIKHYYNDNFIWTINNIKNKIIHDNFRTSLIGDELLYIKIDEYNYEPHQINFSGQSVLIYIKYLEKRITDLNIKCRKL